MDMQSLANEYNEIFASLSPQAILQFILQKHPNKVAFSTSLGAEDQVITAMLMQIDKNARIFTLDTGRLFPETYELIEKTEARYGMRIQLYFPDTQSVEKMVSEKGINLFYYSVENRKLCCGIRKIEPLKRALAGNEIWITGLRKQQSPTRTDMNVAEYDTANNILKINPLLHWSEEMVWDYIHQNNVPFHVLHSKGFPSIGCKPCTRAIEPGEDIRAGRWWWENPDSKECGLHR